MRRGFFSLVTAGLVLLAILAYASSSLLASHQGYGHSRELEAKRVAESMADATAALNRSLEDAVLDSAWAGCGCNGTNRALMNSTAIATRLNSYFNATLQGISDQVVTVEALNLTLQDYNPASCNATFTVNATYALRSASANARIASTVNDVRSVTTYNTSREFNATITGRGAGYTLRVFC